jgi:hypothetical protein
VSYKKFVAAVRSPELRAIAHHWNDARGNKRMPGWKDINPIAIAPYLANVWSWIYDRDSDTFVGRLAGEAINDAFGENLRGKRMQDFFAKNHYDEVFARHKRVVTEPVFLLGQGQVFLYTGRHAFGERTLMPLAADGIHGDGILGAAVYPVNRAMGPNIKTTKDDLEGEQIAFFPLD